MEDGPHKHCTCGFMVEDGSLWNGGGVGKIASEGTGEESAEGVVDGGPGAQEAPGVRQKE